jgi:Elongation factor Tu domain 2
MATRKKAKVKSKSKRKKTPATKAAKAPRRKASPKKARPKKARSTAKAKSKPASPPARPAPKGKRIGVVTHYFGHVSVAIVRLESGTLRVGDMIHIQGHTTDFKQKVESLQVDHLPATEVGPKDDFGLKVVEHAREHDVVFKVKS